MGNLRVENNVIDGNHYRNIGFSTTSPLHVPTAQEDDGNHLIATHPFYKAHFPNILAFAERLDTQPGKHVVSTFWGNGDLHIAGKRVLAIHRTRASETNHMMFQLKSSRINGNEPAMRLSASLKYTSPQFIVIQFAELSFTGSKSEMLIGAGVASTLIVGGARLFGHVRDKYDLALHGGVITLNDIFAVKQKLPGYVFDDKCALLESWSTGLGYRPRDEVARDHEPNLVIAYAAARAEPAVHDYAFNEPSLTVLDNVPLMDDEGAIEYSPITVDLMSAMAGMYPHFPMAKTPSPSTALQAALT